ncbi:G-type lectin S-receptor-like serine/threonine-protein kinase At4g27290 isoform X2 [Ipomoea triloba]|uniref:G-type lectin S-receptor-like serine/threonine-protein kinase At4g27290 isoform X2 n=1 Tax=Ipomoea triloba TaxID=35885 RepID=UPI00125D1BAD|nr:G-type lectin S-receptor-like serine/threonine-protein kinase At4g27290 isoform X2 [Ipomoea triloba]
MACVCRILYVLFLAFFCNNLGVSSYILRAGEPPVTPNRTLFSAGGEFALGFFRPGNSSSSPSFLGIWYTPLNSTVIWVANRESPLPHHDSEPLFKLSNDGNLQLLDGRRNIIWSTNISGAGLARNPVEAYLQTNGNLILKQGDSQVWESFDDAGGNTLMPGMKLKVNTKTKTQNIIRSWTSLHDPRPGKFSWGMDPKGSPQFFIWKENSPYYRSNLYQDGFTKSMHFSKLGHTTTYSFAAENDEVYFRYFCDNPLIQMRFVLTPDGYIEAMVRKTKSDQWRIPWKVPRNPCEFYARCGSFGSCEKIGFSSHSICRCLEGFKPKSQREWENGNYSSGCERKREFRCHSKDDKFKKLEKMKWPDFSVSLGNMAFGECEAKCYSNCSCTAFAYANISERHPANCLNWFGDLVDLTYNYSVGVNAFGQDLYVRVHSSELDNGSSGNGHSDHYLVAKIVAPVSGFFLVCVLVYILKRKCFKSKDWLCKRSAVDNSMSTSPLVGNDEIELLQFSLQRIIDATNNFDTTNKLGEGGFGPVYKGFLSEFGMVAIKRLSKRSSQGLEEFMNELKLIAKLQHTNLVSLLGCCTEDEEKILIYEYLPKRSLDKFLFDPLEKHHLDWSTRAQIIEGIAQGILYLHKYSRLKVIHRDLKASNILLCETMKPKISDFGMARIFGLDQTQAETNHVVGTYGYIPPEYVLRGQFSEKSDVFSFGVLLLEIVSGQKNSEFFHQTHLSDTLLGWAWVNWKEGRPLEFVDSAIRESCDSLKVIRCIEVGLLCVQTIPTDRPTMSNVVRLLCTDHATPIPPLKEPAFVASHSNANVSTSHREVSGSYSQNEITISVLESR